MMVEHKVEDGHKLRAWKGTPGDIADLFDRAHALVCEIEPTEEHKRPSITVKTNGEELEFSDPDEFREHGASNAFANSADISGSAGMWYRSGVHVLILLDGSFQSMPGLRLSASGTNHVAVSGVMSQLAKQADKGKRRRPALGWAYLAAIACAFGVAFAGNVAMRRATGALDWVIFGAVVSSTMAIGSVYFWLPLIVPNLEILDPADPRSRYERWRSKLLAAAGAILIAVIGAALSAVL